MSETPQAYTQRVLSYVEGQEPIRVQRASAGKLKKLVRGLDRKQLTWRPAPGKWSIAEILAHVADTEIVAAWRLRLILGSNGAPVQGFDQDSWAAVFKYAKADVKRSIEIFSFLREMNLAMLKSVPRELWDNSGIHSERGKESVAHIVRMFAGHDTNHIRQIEEILTQLKNKKKSKKRKK